MAIGDFLVRTNSADTAVLPNTGTNLDTLWDTTEKSYGSSITYGAGTFTLPTGMYLIMYSDEFYTSDSTNNERITATGEVVVNDVATGGYSGDYIRKASGQQSMILSGAMFHEVTGASDDIKIRFYRTDNSTTGAVKRVTGTGGVQIINLDNTHKFATYQTTADESTSGSTVRTLNLSSNLRQDTGFNRSGSTVTVSTAGRYLVTYSMKVSETATGREDIVGYLRRNGATAVVGSYSYCYLRGSDASQAGAITWTGLVDVAANDTFDIQWSCPTSATITGASGATLQFWQIPSASKEILLEATDGSYNDNASFIWDTISHNDSSLYSHTAGTSDITIQDNDYTLAFATLHQDAPDSPQRAYPTGQFRVDGVIDNTAASAAYHRNSGGSGHIAITTSSILTTLQSSVVDFYTSTGAATGTLTNDSGQLGLISLSQVFGVTYAFPPVVTSVNPQIDLGDTGIVAEGANFGTNQGTGKVEIGDSPIYASATLVQQTVTSWGDTSIVFDAVLTGFTEGSVWVFVTSDSGLTSSEVKTNYGVPAYKDIVKSLNPDILHLLDNTYVDEMGNDDADNLQAGSVGFNQRPLCRGAVYSWAANNTASRTKPADSPYTNITNKHKMRYVGGWVQLGQVYLVPSGFYEEGGGVNNIYMVVGFGNILLGNIADSSKNFKIQAYSDFKLSVNRPYHVMVFFEDANTLGEFGMYVDGVKVSKTDGNPLTSTDGMSTHSGDWSYGQPDGTLDTGGTDIQYPSAPNLDINYFGTWSALGGGAPLSAETIRVDLFEKGAIETDLITSGTESDMQLQVDALANTGYIDKPLPLKVSKTGGDLRLELDNITFDSRCSMHIQWMGTTGQTLTVVNNGTSNCDLSFCSTPYNGSILVENPVTFTVYGLITGSIFEIYDNEVVNLENHDTKLSYTNNSGTSFQYSHNGINNDIFVKMFADGYKEVIVPFTLVGQDQTLTLTPEKEINA